MGFVKKLFIAIRYAFIFNKAVGLAEVKKYKEAYEAVRKIDKQKLKEGRTKFRLTLFEAVLQCSLGNYQFSKHIMEYLYGTVNYHPGFNASEKEYLKIYIVETYNLLKDVIYIENDLIPAKLDKEKVNFDRVSVSIKNIFPI